MAAKTVKTEDKLDPTSEATKIWSDIKDVKLDMFSLPDQYVDMYCEPVPIDPSKLFLTYKVPALLPMLEEALKGKFSVELNNKYIVVTRV